MTTCNAMCLCSEAGRPGGWGEGDVHAQFTGGGIVFRACNAKPVRSARRGSSPEDQHAHPLLFNPHSMAPPRSHPAALAFRDLTRALRGDGSVTGACQALTTALEEQEETAVILQHVKAGPALVEFVGEQAGDDASSAALAQLLAKLCSWRDHQEACLQAGAAERLHRVVASTGGALEREGRSKLGVATSSRASEGFACSNPTTTAARPAGKPGPLPPTSKPCRCIRRGKGCRGLGGNGAGEEA